MSSNELIRRQILDSRGNPTLEVEVVTSENFLGVLLFLREHQQVFTTVELRDGGDKWMGKGVSKAVDNVNIIMIFLDLM